MVRTPLRILGPRLTPLISISGDLAYRLSHLQPLDLRPPTLPHRSDLRPPISHLYLVDLGSGDEPSDSNLDPPILSTRPYPSSLTLGPTAVPLLVPKYL